MSASDFLEDIISHLPALQVLCNLGYQYLTPSEVNTLRDQRKGTVLLKPILEQQLRKLNQIEYKGQTVPFSDANIKEAIDALNVPLNDGFVKANETVYELLTLGKSLSQTFLGDRQISTTTRKWKRMEEINVGDKFVAYLSGNRFFATGTVIGPRQKQTPKDSVDSVEDYVKRKESHNHKRGYVYYTPAFYENIDDKWRHPIHRLARYAQRIDIDGWKDRLADGVAVKVLRDIPPNEIQMAVFEIAPEVFEAIETELTAASQADERITASDDLSSADVSRITSEVIEADYFSPSALKDERERRERL